MHSLILRTSLMIHIACYHVHTMHYYYFFLMINLFLFFVFFSFPTLKYFSEDLDV